MAGIPPPPRPPPPPPPPPPPSFVLKRSTRNASGAGSSAGASPGLLQSACAVSLLDAALSGTGLRFVCGGAECGGHDATKLFVAAFHDLDSSILSLTGVHRSAERAVLMEENGGVVAAAVVHVHTDHHILEIPIFATATTSRRKGHGSVLMALLLQLARRLALKTAVVSATDESRAFWMKQGMHTMSFYGTGEKAAIRTLKNYGLVHAFSNSILMARPVGSGVGASSDDSVGGGTELEVALRRRETPIEPGLSARRAMAACNYVDIIDSGSFWLTESGERQPIVHEEHEKLPQAFDWVPYKNLEAFYVGSDRGWGLRCTKPIREGHFVVEVLGRCLNEEEQRTLEDDNYAIGFPDDVMEAKRQVGDDLHFIDPKEHGTMMRFVNDSQEAPNLMLVYWPQFDKEQGIMPTRAFLVAQHDIPSHVELTFNYGKHYNRTWLQSKRGGAAAAASQETLPSPSTSEVVRSPSLVLDGGDADTSTALMQVDEEGDQRVEELLGGGIHAGAHDQPDLLSQAIIFERLADQIFAGIHGQDLASEAIPEAVPRACSTAARSATCVPHGRCSYCCGCWFDIPGRAEVR